MHFEVAQGLRVNDLASQQDRVRLRGGRLVAYAAVVSVLFLSARNYRVKWIASPAEKTQGGISSSVLSAVFGWWSLQGPYYTIAALVWNFRGGVDITDALLRVDPRSSSLLGYADEVRLSEFEEGVRRIALRIFWGSVLVLIAAIALFVWSSARK